MKHRLLAARVGVVAGEEVFEDERVAPALLNHIVEYPDELIRVLPRADERELHLRRRRQVEAAPARLADDLGDAPLLLLGVESAPVLLLDRHARVLPDGLKRRADAFEHE
jgi:hypothetical protein